MSGAIRVSGGITPTYSTPSFSAGQIGQIINCTGTVISSFNSSSANLYGSTGGISITPGCWLFTWSCSVYSGASTTLTFVLTNGTTSAIIFGQQGVVQSYGYFIQSGSYPYITTANATITMIVNSGSSNTIYVANNYFMAVRIA